MIVDTFSVRKLQANVTTKSLSLSLSIYIYIYILTQKNSCIHKSEYIYININFCILWEFSLILTKWVRIIYTNHIWMCVIKRSDYIWGFCHLTASFAEWVSPTSTKKGLSWVWWGFSSDLLCLEYLFIVITSSSTLT